MKVLRYSRKLNKMNRMCIFSDLYIQEKQWSVKRAQKFPDSASCVGYQVSPVPKAA